MPGTTLEAPVDRPVDGDTVRVLINGRSEALRILALDTEESRPGGDKPMTPWGVRRRTMRPNCSPPAGR
jgi:micrococcal nuclease